MYVPRPNKNAAFLVLLPPLFFRNFKGKIDLPLHVSINLLLMFLMRITVDTANK